MSGWKDWIVRNLLGGPSESRSLSLENPATPLSAPADWLFETLSGGFGIDGQLHVNEHTAMQLNTVRACVRAISEDVGTVPLHLFRKLKGNAIELADDRNEYWLLHRQPNPNMTACIFRETMTANMLLWGNAYAEIEYNGAGKITALWPLYPAFTRMQLIPGTDRRLRYITSNPIDGKERAILNEDMIHLKGTSLDGYQGLYTIRHHRVPIGLALALENYGLHYFMNGSRPGGVLEVPGTLTPEAQQRIRESWQHLMGGPRNANRVAILEQGMKFTGVAITNDNAQYIENRKLQADEIARMFRVPPHVIGILEKATFCLPAGTEVLTDLGPKPVESVAVGDSVWSRDRGAWCKRKVVQSACSGEDEILTIRTTNRTIRANARHRIRTRRKYAWPRTGRGGYQAVAWADEYIPAGDLKVGDTLVVLDGGMDAGSNRTPTRAATVGFMEFCGLLLGDGNVHPGYVTIARAGNSRYMDHYRDVMCSEFVQCGSGNIRSNLALARVHVHLTEGERYTRFSSVLASDELTQLGLSGTARTKSVPGWIYEMSQELRLAFVRGFFDADGHVDKKGRMSASSCNRELLSGIRHLCMMAGIPVTNLRCQRGRTTLPNGREMDFAQWSFTCSDPGANARIGSNDPVDIERIKSGKPFARKARSYPRFGGQGEHLTGVSLSRITAIDRSEPEPVYDIEVEGSHNFVADGVVVHNSNIEHQSLDYVKSCLRPHFERWEQELNIKMFPSDRSYRFEHDEDGLLRGDFGTRMEGYSKGRQWGWLSVNDIRLHENLNPIGAEGDIYLTPLNMAPADQAGDIAKAALAPKKPGIPEDKAPPVETGAPPEEDTGSRALPPADLRPAVQPMFADAVRRALSCRDKQPQKFISKAFTPVLTSMARLQGQQAGAEVTARSYADELHLRLSEWEVKTAEQIIAEEFELAWAAMSPPPLLPPREEPPCLTQ